MRIDGIEIVMKDINEIIPYWRNPRKNDKTVDALIPVIEKNGFNVPIVIDKHNVVVKGHARLKAARKMGMTQVPCIVSNASDEVIKADRIADNKIQEMSSWDFAKRDIELERLGDSMTFGRLFMPEENPVGNEVFDVKIPEYAPVDIGDFYGGDDFSEPERISHETPTNEYYASEHEYYSDAEAGNGSEETVSTQIREVRMQRKYKTLCPYCGKVVEVLL